MIARIQQGGARAIAFAPSLAVARRMAKQKIDALVIEGSEAGGHIGPVSTSILAQEILPAMRDELPVFVAGGIGHGEFMLAYLEMGAAGCQLGTRFVCAHESRVHAQAKQAYLRAPSRDATVSVQLDARFPVIPVRALTNEASHQFREKQREMIAEVDKGALELAAAQLQIEHFWAGALRRGIIDGDVEHGSLMAGQSVGMLREEESVTSIISTLQQQALTALQVRMSG